MSSTSVIEQLSTASLYERLGGSAGIRKLVDGIVEAHMSNPVIKARFLPYQDAPERVAEIKKHTCDYLAAGSGGPAAYHGRSMAEAHRGMNVSEAEYMAATDDIMNTMTRHGYDAATRNEVLVTLYSLKDDIIGV